VNDVLPGHEEPALPVSGTAVLTGVLVAYGAFAVLISIVAAFANGAHSHQVLSAATWKQLGTGGGIVTGIALFVAWAAGGLVAARAAGRDGIRHGVWAFVIGVVLMTVVGAAITWLPDTTAILRNLRLLGLPVRRNEWRDIGSVAGLSTVLGMAAGAVFGGWWAMRQPAVRPVRVPVPAAAPGAAPLPPTVEEGQEEQGPEPAFVGPSLFDKPAFASEARPDDETEAPSPLGPAPEPFGVPEPPSAPEPEARPRETPAWLQFVEERERAFREREFESPVAEPVIESEPAPAFIEEPDEPEPPPASEPVEVTSWWPGPADRSAAPADEPSEPERAYDEAWALPDDDEGPGTAEPVEDAAFPHPPPTPVPEPEVVGVTPAPPPPQEHAEWTDEGTLFQAPPDPTEDELEQAPEAPVPDLSPEEQEARRRQQEEAARAYEQAREDE
jgi:hypothetical protein